MSQRPRVSFEKHVPGHLSPVDLDLPRHALAEVLVEVHGGYPFPRYRSTAQTHLIRDAVGVFLSQRPRVVHRLLEIIETFGDHRILGYHLPAGEEWDRSVQGANAHMLKSTECSNYQTWRVEPCVWVVRTAFRIS